LAVIGQELATAGLTTVDSAGDRIVAVSVQYTGGTLTGDFVTKQPAGHTGIASRQAAGHRVTALVAGAEQAIVGTVAIVGSVGADAADTEIIGAIDAVITVGVHHTFPTSVRGLRAKQTGSTGIAGRDTVGDSVAALVAIAIGPVVRAVEIVGAGLTSATRANIVGAGYAVVAIGITAAGDASGAGLVTDLAGGGARITGRDAV